MTLFLWSHLFYLKKKKFLSLFLTLFLMIILIYTYPKEAFIEYQLYPGYYQLTYDLYMKNIYKLVLPTITTLLLMDHDQMFLKPLYSYFGRLKIILTKTYLYLIILTTIHLVFALFYHLVPLLLTSYYQLSHHQMIYLTHLYLDQLIILIIIFYFIREKHQSFSIMIPVFYIFLSIYLSDLNKIELYYLIPIYIPQIEDYSLAYLYKVCYILLGLTMTFKKMNTESL
jgi:hypothetical protein